MTREPSDQELMAGLQQRDHQALALLYDRYARSVYSLALHILRDQAAAEDVTQEVFLQLWRQPERYAHERGPLGPWLLRVTRNRAIDLLRRSGRERRPPYADARGVDFHLADPSPGPDEHAWSSTVATRVQAALGELSDTQRQVIELAYFRGLTQREMADVLGLPLGTVKTRVRTALRRLAEILTRDGVWTDVG
ncbi:sigma-70 family RNA polymerase sigma factor [Thermomicrobiaceae bacterium CFH 74404]|uniref:Sigma-70 family RNA polymerase sigma factor n=1 Tax=Thermalbibacter longus TaxID=2951981 RepID=A0AA41WCF0_9BACT|nr:sigma-70 family RNA polymerase sigma factor [Thermalbibacter longus]MCM8750604.1 sigma-70 family RNA polymerase sigma factor [Thermalbibacter longus]